MEFTATGDDDVDEPTFDEIQELQQLASYQDRNDEAGNGDDIPTNDHEVEFDVDSDEEASLDTFQSPEPTSPFSLPSRRSSAAFGADTSVPLPHKRATAPISKFIFAMGLWCEDVSASKYASLRQILRMLEPHKEISVLPESVSTLKNWAKSQMPLLPLRQKTIPLKVEKLPSLRPSLKDSEFSPSETLYFFDPVHLFSTFLSSPQIIAKMHVGFAEFVDSPTQLWHSRSWSSSIRSTSGQFAHYSDGQPIFPSDFVQYQCVDLSCRCQDKSSTHLGRILAVGKDYRSTRKHPGAYGDVAIEVQKTMRLFEWPEFLSEMPSPAITPKEIVLIESSEFLPDVYILTRELNVSLDYSFSSRVTSSFVSPSSSGQYFVRRIFNPQTGRIRPLNQNAPIRGELEISEFTRQHLVDNFDKYSTVISVPLLTFIDGFGLFRNMYRTLMGVYLIIAAFTFRERSRRSNVLPLTLGPHGSNFSDVVNALQALYHLDAGQVLKINNKDTLVCVYTLAYLGDMPQQQENSGFLSAKAKLSCRFCFAKEKDRANIDYDIIGNGRFHHETLRMRDKMRSLSKTNQSAYSTSTGIGVSPPPLVTISPSLDLILTRPSDPAHSEYAGITKQLHLLLMNAILTIPCQKQYADELRKFRYPSGWGRLQSPVHHLGSYSLQEHARWSVIVPGLLRLWLRVEHIQPLFLRGIEKAWKGHIPAGMSSLHFIVLSFAAVGRSNALLMSDVVSTSERAQFGSTIRLARQYYQQLLEAAAIAASDNPRRSRSVTPQSRSATPALGQEISPEEAKKAKEYRQDQQRPNVHVGIHYEEVMKEYALPSNCNVLIGEDKHRWFKKIVYNTNFSNVERHLLMRESLQQTTRLILLDAYQSLEPELTATFKDLYDTCPTLFESLLPRSEQLELESEETEAFQSILGDTHHLKPRVMSRLKPTYCRDELGLPIRSSALTAVFKHHFRTAYADDYGLPNIVQFGTKGLVWCKKLGFMDKATEQRLVFNCGDVIQYHDNKIGRLDRVVSHELMNVRRVFCLVTEVSLTQHQRDDVLGVPLLQLSKDQVLIGLPAISGRKLYMLPVSRDSDNELIKGDDMLLWVNWQIQFL